MNHLLQLSAKLDGVISFGRGDAVKKLIGKQITKNPHGNRVVLSASQHGALKNNLDEFNRYNPIHKHGKGFTAGTDKDLATTRNAIAAKLRRLRRA